MSRGDRREKIFLDDVDRQDLIKTVKAIAARVHLASSKSANANLRRYLRQDDKSNPRRGRRGQGANARP